MTDPKNDEAWNRDPVPCEVPNSLVLGIFFLVFLFIYGSVLVVDYGYREDYQTLAGVLQYPHPVDNVEKKYAEGRPLFALGTKLFVDWADDIKDFRYARFMGIVGISLLGWWIYYMLVRTGRCPFQSFCVGVIICSSVPIQFYATWALAAMMPFAAFASGVALYLADRVPAMNRLGRKLLLVSGGTVALLAAVTIYQPAAMFFWVFAAMALLTPEASFPLVIRRFMQYFMIWSIALLLGSAVYKLGTILVPDFPARGRLVEDVSSKIGWFLTYPLPISMNPVVVVQSHGTSILSGYIFLTVIVVGVFMYFSGDIKTRILKFGMAAAILILCSSPLLADKESNISYRILLAPTGIGLLYGFFAFHGYARNLRIHDRANIFLGFAAIGCALLAAYQTLAYIVVPQAQELTIMQTRLGEIDSSRKNNIHVILPDPTYTLSPVRAHEFGDTSSRTGTDMSSKAALYAISMVRLLQRDMSLPVTHGTARDPVPSGSHVVDMHKMIGHFWRQRRDIMNE